MEVFLELLASGGYYRQIGQIVGVHKTSAYNYSRLATNFFAITAQRYINLPQREDLAGMSLPLETVEGEQKRVVLYIDGFIVKIQRPDHSGDAFFCGRPGKSCDGINVQYVVDRRGQIRHIVTGIPGSSHDATAIRWSNTFMTFLDNLPENFVVLGDPAYRGVHEKLLHTYIGRNLTHAQLRYNQSATRIRQIVERSIGASQLKWRIQQLKENRLPAKNNTDFASKCTIAAAVLHNRFTNFL